MLVCRSLGKERLSFAGSIHMQCRCSVLQSRTVLKQLRLCLGTLQFMVSGIGFPALFVDLAINWLNVTMAFSRCWLIGGA